MYINPGKTFLDQHGTIQSIEDVLEYIHFLRKESGLGIAPPIDLSQIYRRFDFAPKRAPLNKQQGLVVNPDLGIILIREQDIETRQRFTEAHELIELMFIASSTGQERFAKDIGHFKYEAKEKLCNEGAAELLMPKESFQPRIHRMGMSYETGRLLATEFSVSVSAALVQMVNIGVGRHALTLWKLKNKPTEIDNKISDFQLSFLNSPQRSLAPKKLRVEWSFSSPGLPFIPPDKSVPEDSSIFEAWQSGKFTFRKDRLALGTCSGVFQCENQPFEVDGERYVLSLLHFPGDMGCGATLW